MNDIAAFAQRLAGRPMRSVALTLRIMRRTHHAV